MAGDPHVEISWNDLTAAVNKAIGELEKQFAQYQAEGDEVRAAATRARINLISAGAGGGVAEQQAAAAAVQRTNELLTQQAALKRLGSELDLQMLNTLREQAVAEQELLAARMGMGAGTRRYTSYGETAGQQAAVERELAAQQAYLDQMVRAEGAGRQEALSIAREQLAADRQRAAVLAEQARQAEIAAGPARAQEVGMAQAAAYGAGQEAARRGGLVSPADRAALANVQGLTGAMTSAQRESVRLATAMGEYDEFATQASLRTESLNANLLRMGMLENEASNAMRQHGALTTEYLSALARGETTVKEFGYQVGATIGKFAGWTAAAAATYGALGAVAEFGKGAIDAANGATKLQRTIEGIDPTKANNAIQKLSQDTNVSVAEAADAIFQYSRTFHSLDDATAAARDGLSALKLDNVSLSDSVRLSTALNQQYGVSAQGLVVVYNQLSAAQREFNARISDMVPLLQRSTGAVKNAGGDLNELIALGAYAARTTQYSGSQVGTAFYRSAATFLSPTTSKGQTDRAVLQALGIDVNQGWTGIIRDALVRSVTLSGADRGKLANAIFGPQFGGRMSAIFNPQSVPMFLQMTRQLTPQATQGSLQSELNRELATARERMRSFVNEMQRMGAALGSSGIINVLSGVVHGVTSVSGEFRGLINMFDGLSPAVKEAVIGLTALRALMMFTQRTRFGSTAADLTRLSKLPGFGASEAQRVSFDMRAGTSTALEQVNAELSRTRAQLLAMAAEAGALAETRAKIQAGDNLSREEIERSNKINAQISQLEADRNALEAQQNSLLMQREGLIEQRRKLERSPARGGYSDEERLALFGASSAGTQAAADAEARSASQAGVLVTARAKLKNALNLSLTEQEAMAAETGLGTAAMGRASTLAEGAATGMVGMKNRMMGFIESMGVFNIALLALPFVLGEFSNVINNANNAAQAANAQAAAPITDITSIESAAREYARRARAAQRAGDPGGIGGFFAHLQYGAGEVLGGSAGRALRHPFDAASSAAAQAQQTSAELTALGRAYTVISNGFNKDIVGLLATKEGKQKVYEISQRLKQAVGRMTQEGLHGLDDKDIGRMYQAFANALQQDYTAAAAAQFAKTRDPASQFQTALAMDPATLAKQLQANEDYQKVFGTSNTTLQQTLSGYAAFLTHAAAPGAENNDTLMQEVATAQSNFVNAVTKQVSGQMRSATLATTTAGQEGALAEALATIHNAESQIKAMMSKFKDAPKVLAGLQELMGLIAEQGKQINQQILQVMQSQAAVQTSSIIGISPEADIQRAKVDLQTREQQLAYATQHGFDAQTVNDLQSQVNTAKQTLLKQSTDNARNIVDASGKLAQSQITGIDPASDIARTRAALDTANRLLQFDVAHGAGEAAILTAQANVFDAQRTLNEQIQQRDQQIQSDAQAFIDAQAKLAESQTTSPVQIAQDELRAAIAKLATIHPQDYKTHQEYETALMQAQAGIGDAQKNLTQSIVSTRMDTLKYELDTQQITGQQYIDGLNRLLSLHKLSQQDIMKIRQEIFDTAHAAAVNLDVGNITLPTSYEVRRAIAGALQSRGRSAVGAAVIAQNNTHNDVHVVFNVEVAHDHQIKKVTDALSTTLRSHTQGLTQAVGP